MKGGTLFLPPIGAGGWSPSTSTLRLGVTDLIPDILISEPQNSDRRNLEACAWTLGFYAKSSSAQGFGEGLVNIHCVLLVSSGWWDDD